MLPNTLVIKISRSLLRTTGEFIIHVTGFSPRRLSAANRYAEWVLPAGNYQVAVEHAQHKIASQFVLSHGKRAEMEVISCQRFTLGLGLCAGAFLTCAAIGFFTLLNGSVSWPMFTLAGGFGIAAFSFWRQYRRSVPFFVRHKGVLR